MAKFVKGQSGNPAGKPKGAKDQKWRRLSFWYGLIESQWDQLKPSDRAWIAMAGFKACLGRSNFTTEEELLAAHGKTQEVIDEVQKASQEVERSADVA